MTPLFGKRVARSAIQMNPNLSAEEKQRLLSGLREEFSSSSLSKPLIPGVFDPEIMKLASDNPELARLLQEMALVPKESAQGRLINRKIRGLLHKNHREIERRKSNTERERSRFIRVKAAIDEVVAWQARPIELQRPEHSMLPKLLADALEGDVHVTTAVTDAVLHAETLLLYTDAWSVATAFVVEHDWAAVFANAIDFAHGAFPLPAPISMFEFRIGGLPVCVLASQADSDDHLAMIMAIRSKNGWVVNGTAQLQASGAFVTRKVKDGPLEPIPSDDEGTALLRYLAGQIRAVSIALDAEVAISTPVRAPHRSNRPPKDRKELPDYSYHVVSLSKRSRAERAEPDPNVEPGRRRRLHCRRGHWRHYSTSKTWINWMLVGDPDLGFVDKHYKL